MNAEVAFYRIDGAAALCRPKLVVHGHHHESYRGVLADGTRVRGLAKAKVSVSAGSYWDDPVRRLRGQFPSSG